MFTTRFIHWWVSLCMLQQLNSTHSVNSSLTSDEFSRGCPAATECEARTWFHLIENDSLIWLFNKLLPPFSLWLHQRRSMFVVEYWYCASWFSGYAFLWPSQIQHCCLPWWMSCGAHPSLVNLASVILQLYKSLPCVKFVMSTQLQWFVYWTLVCIHCTISSLNLHIYAMRLERSVWSQNNVYW